MAAAGGSGDGSGAITLLYRNMIIIAPTQVLGKLLQHLSNRTKENLWFYHELYIHHLGSW